MAAGIQCFNASGQVIFDQTTSVVKFLGIVEIGSNITGEARYGNFYVPQFTQYYLHTPFFTRIDGGFQSDGYDAGFWINPGSQYLEWQFPREQVQYYNGVMYNRPYQRVLYGIL